MFWAVVFFLPTLLPSAEALIPLNSKLIAGESAHWASPSGRFALTFFTLSDQPDRFAAGVLFLSPPAVLWSAGAGEPVAPGSHLLLSSSGELLLFDSSRRAVVWTTNTSRVVSADVLDDGNLVLLGQRKEVLWQSFDTPSDTLAPGQALTMNRTLRAAGPGSVASPYTLSLDPAGQLKLTWQDNVTYWETPAAAPPSSAVFSGEGSLQVLDRGLKPVWTGFGADHGDGSVAFRFVRLDADGNLRMYSLSQGSGRWAVVWQAVQNQCHVFATCGLHGLCFFNSSASAACKCPFGSSSSSSSCIAPYKRSCSHGATITTLKHTSIYGVYPPEEDSSVVSVDDCRTSCLEDPDCSSATWTNDGVTRCLKKKTPFVSGYEDPSLNSVSFVKLCPDPFAVILPAARPPARPSSRRADRRLVAAGAAAFLTVVAVQLGLGVWFLIWRRKREKEEEAGPVSVKLRMSSGGLVKLTLTEVKAITGEFKRKLGDNSYRGVLPSKKPVVVRELPFVDSRQFQRWVAVLGSVHHRNLAKIEAFSSDQKERFIVYEFARNGSVARWRAEPRLGRRLTWEKRMEICKGVARAMAYLHSECREFICHGRLSWSNVVLDDAMHAKVTDYGLVKLVNGGDFSSEDDVARFGEMVIGLVTGSDPGPAYPEGSLLEALDPGLGGRAEYSELERALRIGFWCVHPDPRLRPAMAEVAKVLDGSLPVDPPPTADSLVDRSKTVVESDSDDVESN